MDLAAAAKEEARAQHGTQTRPQPMRPTAGVCIVRDDGPVGRRWTAGAGAVVLTLSLLSCTGPTPEASPDVAPSTREPSAHTQPHPQRRPLPVPQEWRSFAHLMPYALNNSVRGLERAHRLGHRAIDLDFTITRDGHLVNCHFRHPVLHGYVDPLGRIGRHTPMDELTLADVRRLRFPRGGHRIQTVETMFREAARLGLRVEFEAKNSPRFDRVETFRRVRELADKYDLSVQVKRASFHPRTPQVLAAAHEAGLVTIVLPRNKRRLKRADYWAVTDYVRGSVRWF